MGQSTDGHENGSDDRRIRNATLNDNGGGWYLCETSRNAALLHQSLERVDVSAVLKNTIGGVLGSNEFHELTGKLYIQINVMPEYQMWQVEAALLDLDVEICALVPTVPLGEQ